MFETLSAWVNLSPQHLFTCLVAVFIAGMVRGFSGFALSAVVMASVATIVPPIQLIPVAYILEGVASLIMLRGGVRDADMSIVWVLAIGSAIGVPIGLYFTTSFPAEITKVVALSLIIALAMLQLFKITPKFVGTRAGLYGTGLFAGVATGLAHVGGMVVALYVFASNVEARRMRGSLVMFLFLGMFTSLVWHLFYGIMDGLVLRRGLVFAPTLILGLFIGVKLFKPSLESFYKRFCLSLLILLSCAGLFSVLS